MGVTLDLVQAGTEAGWQPRRLEQQPGVDGTCSIDDTRGSPL